MDELDEILARAAQRDRKLEEMHARYEAMDQAEYAEFNAEMDARDAEREENPTMNDVPANSAYTDAEGRTTADRINAVQRHGDPITTQQRKDARLLLESLLLAAALHGHTIDDFDWVADLPGACIDVTTAKARKNR